MRRIAVTLSIALMFSVIVGDLQANEKKPNKDNSSSTKTLPENSNANSPDKGMQGGNSGGESKKFQDPIPVVASSPQPVAVVDSSSLNRAPESRLEQSGNASKKGEAEPAPNTTTQSPESASKNQALGNPAGESKSQAPEVKNESGKPAGQSSQPGVTGATSAKDKREVVSAKAFSNTKLVARKSGGAKVNASASLIDKNSRDPNCGAPEKALTAKSNANSSKSGGNSEVSSKGNKGGTGSLGANGNAAKPEIEECKDYILVFSDDSSKADIDAAAKVAKGKILKNFNKVFRGALVNAPPSKIRALEKNPKVESIELDGVVTRQDVYANPVWGLDRVDQRSIPLDQIYDDLGNSGNTIPVYVVDTGIYAEHTEFFGRVAPGATTIDDGYGTWDCNGHGTHVSGSIAGKTYGLAKTATLVPVRVLDCSGSGSYSGVIAGLDWIATNHAAGIPAVVNMSLGGPASSSLDTAVNNLISRGITVVVAAGNSGADACNYSPARVPGAITVAAAGIDDVRANFSNFGSCVDVFAPGVGITSAWINGVTGVAVASGTSMASPHVAGAVARFLYTNPNASPFQVANSLALSATVDAISNAGPGTPNRNLYIDIALDPTNQTPTATKPGKSRKTTNPGKGSKS